MGRLTRTPISRKTINVYLDEKIARIIAFSKLPSAATELYRNVRKELGEMLGVDEEIVNQMENKTEEERKANAYDLWNKQCSHNITTLVQKCNCTYRYTGQDEILKRREELKTLNNLFLKLPQVDDLSVIPDLYQGYYKGIDELPTDKRAPIEIARLSAFMKIRSVRDYFLKNEYYVGTSLNAQYWISESAIQQLYLPRVAEYAFKALMEGVGLTVRDLPNELYERADWVVEGKNRIYVDVKYWAHNEHEEQSDIDDWKQKAELCNDGLYVIVNVPIYPDVKYKKEHTYRVGNDCKIVVINGLVNISTGEVDQESINAIQRLATN